MRAWRGFVGVLAAVLLAVLAVPGAASADVAAQAREQQGPGPTVTFDEAAFLAATAQAPWPSRVVVTETFARDRDFPPEQRTVTYHGVRFRSLDPAYAPYWRVDQVSGLYRAFTGGVDDPDAAITFAGSGAVKAFGVLLHPFGYPNQFAIRVVEANGKVTVVRLPSDAGDTFVGLASRPGIVKVVVQQLPDQAQGVVVNFGFLRFVRSPILPAC